VLGAQITQDILDEEQVQWVRGHHERPDGRGYPDALHGSEIPEGALLVGLADAFDSMTKGRSYQMARTTSDALDEMRALAGTQFDRRLVELLEAWTLESKTTATATHTLRPEQMQYRLVA
jgi:HD-GYP domain-containing protein (c-di-GMP phosphodiesterase class II)